MAFSLLTVVRRLSGDHTKGKSIGTGPEGITADVFVVRRYLNMWFLLGGCFMICAPAAGELV